MLVAVFFAPDDDHEVHVVGPGVAELLLAPAQPGGLVHHEADGVAAEKARASQ